MEVWIITGITLSCFGIWYYINSKDKKSSNVSLKNKIRKVSVNLTIHLTGDTPNKIIKQINAETLIIGNKMFLQADDKLKINIQEYCKKVNSDGLFIELEHGQNVFYPSSRILKIEESDIIVNQEGEEENIDVYSL